jgi:[acyl-carrier-protein] S-malonyltransferase
MMLPVSAPFHSSLLKPAAAKLAAYLGGVAVRAPRIPVVNNVDVAVEHEPQRIKEALARQASSPVRWVDTVRRFAADGISHVAECGPGKVLAGLTRRIDDRLQSQALTDPQSLQQALLVLKS